MGTVGHDETTVGHAGDGRLILRAVGVAIDPGLSVELTSGGVVLLHEHSGTAAVGTAIVGPGHHPAAVFQGSDGRIVLVAGSRRIDPELGANRGSRRIVALGEDTVTAQVLTRRGPGDDIAAVLERRHVRIELVAADGGIDLELAAQGPAAGVEMLGVHPGGTSILTVRAPGHHEAAVTQHGDGRLVLVGRTGGWRVGLDLAGGRHAGGGVFANVDIAVAAGTRRVEVVVVPGHGEATVVQRCHVGLVLAARGAFVDPELAPLGDTAGVVTLGIDAGAGTVLVVGAPDDDEAAAGQTHHLGFVLRPGDKGIDLEFRPDGIVVGIVALPVDPVAAGIGPALIGPHHHVTTVGKMGDRGFHLIAGDGGVDRALQPGGDRAIHRGRHVEGDEMGVTGPTVAVGQAHGYRTAGEGVAGRILVGEVFDHRLDALHRGVGIEDHHQLAVVGAIGGDGADLDAAVKHVQAGDADLGGPVALAADAQLILVFQALEAELVLAAVAADVVHLQPSAVEIGGIRIEQANPRVDDLGREVHIVLDEGDAARQIDDEGSRLAGEIGRVAKEPLEDAIGVGAGVILIVLPTDDEITVVQPQDHRLYSPVVVLDVDADLAIHRHAGGVVLLGVDLAAVAPGDDEAAIGEGRHRRLLLAAGGGGIDPELAAQGCAVVGVALGEDARAASTILEVGSPAHHEAAPGQRRDARLVLVVFREGIDAELAAQGRTVGREALPEYPGIAAILAVRAPGDDEAAVVQQGNGRLVLGTALETRAAVGPGFRPLGRTVVVETLEEDVCAATVLGAVGIPGDDETAARDADHGRLILVAGRRGIDDEVIAHLQAVGVVTLAEEPVTTAVAPILVAPDHHEAPASEAGDHRRDLIIGGVVIDLELVADRHPLRVVALSVDAKTPTVLASGLPHGHVAAVGETRHGRSVLLVRGVGIDHFLLIQGLGTVVFGRDVDLHHAGHAGPARPVADLNAHRAGGHRIGIGVGIGQVLDHRFDRHGRGIGVEGDDEVVAIAAIGGDAADGRSAVADSAAGNPHLPRSAPLVADGKNVLQFRILRQLGLLDAAVAGDDADHQLSAVEVGGIAVTEPHRAVDQLRRGIDQVFAEGDAGHHVHQFRRRRAGDGTRRTHDLAENAVGTGGVAFLVVPRPGDHEVAAREPGDVGVVLGAGDGAIHQGRAVDLGAGGVELLDEDVLGAATRTTIHVPGHHEAAAVQRRHPGEVVGGRRIDGADLEFAPGLGPGRIEALAVDVVVRRPPYRHVAASAQGRHVVARLLTAHRGGGHLLDRRNAAVGIEELGKHAVAVAVVAAGIAVKGDELPSPQGRQPRVVLGAGGRAVEGEFRRQEVAAGVVALGQHVVDVARRGVAVVAAVGDDEAAVREPHHSRLVLVAGGAGIGQELPPDLGPAGVVDLRIDAVAGTVESALVGPHHHVAAVGQGSDFRLGLSPQGITVDLELGPHRSALGVVALTVDAVAGSILGVGAPYHHVAAVVGPLQAGHHRNVLLVRLVGVHLPLTKQLYRTVHFRRDVDLHGARRAGAAGAVAHLNADEAGARGVGRGIGVGQVFDDRLDGLSRRVGVEIDHQIGAVGTIAGDGADHRAAVADVAARHPHLPSAIAFVLDGDLILVEGMIRLVLARRDAGHHQLPAVEAGGIGIGELDRTVDQLRRGIDQVFAEGDAGHHVHQFRRRRTGDGTRRAHDLAEDAVGVGGVAFLVVPRPGDHEVAAREPGDVGVVLGAGDGAIHQGRAVDLGAGGVELLDEDVLGAATRTTIHVPGHHEAAAVQRRHPGEVVGGRRIDGADLEFAPGLGPGRIEALAVDVVVRRPPYRHVAASAQGRHVVARLLTAHRGGGHLLDRRNAAVGIEELGKHAVAAAVVAAGVAVEGDELSSPQGGQARVVLGAAGGAVEGEFRRQRVAAGVKPPGQRIVPAEIGGILVVAAVGDDEAAVRESDHRRFVLGARGRRARQELPPDLGPAGVVDLRIDAVAGTVQTALVGPHHHVAAVGQGGDFRFDLSPQGIAVDLELGPHRSALGVVALTVDAVAVAILGVGAPHHHVGTVVGPLQARHHRDMLLVRLKGVHLPLAEEFHRTVYFRRDVDDHLAGGTGGAGTVAHDDGNRAAGVGAVRRGLVAEILDDPLDGLIGGVGVEIDHQLVTVGTGISGIDGADDRAADAYIAARNTHLTGRVALVANGKLILGPAGAGNIGDREAAAVEAVGAAVDQLHGGIEHDARLGLGFAQGDQGGHVLEVHGRRRDGRLDTDQHVGGLTGAAVAVEEAEADIAVGLAGARHRIHVGDVFHQGPGGCGVGAGIEAHHQVGAGSTPAESPDSDPAVADIAAGNADLAGAGSLVAHGDGFIGVADRRAVEEFDDQAAPGEVGRIAVADRHVRVDDLGIPGVVGRGQGIGEVALDEQVPEHRAGLARHLGAVAKNLLHDVVGVVAAAGRSGVIDIGHRVVAVAEVGDDRLVFGAVAGGFELALPVHGVSGGVVFADVDVRRRPRAAEVVVVVIPGHHEAARGQAGDIGLVLAPVGGFVDQEFATHLGAGAVETLAVDAGAGTVLIVGAPHHHEAVVGQHRHRGFVLGPGGLRVDQGLGPELVARRIVALGIDPVAVAVGAALIDPHHDMAAVGARRDIGVGLGAAHGRVDPALRPHLDAEVIEALGIDVVATAAHIAVRGPTHHVAAAIGRDAGLVLGAGGEGIDQSLAPQGDTSGIVALGIDPVAIAVETIGIGPHHDKAAIGQSGDRGFVLGSRGAGIDPEFRPHGNARGGEALGVDAVAGTVLAWGNPGHHVAPAAQGGDGRRILMTRRVGIDLFLTVGRRGTVQILGDVDGERIGVAAAAVAVGDPQAQGAAGVGAGVGVGIAQALDEGFHRFHRRGVAGEVDDQVGAVDAAADRADGSAAIAHRAAGNTDLPGAGALVDHAQLVFDRSVLGVVEIEPAAVEVAGIRVAQTDRRIDHLQAAIDRVFSEGDGADEVGQRRAGRAGEFRGVAEELLVDAVGVGGFGFVVEAAPDHREVALPQIHHRRFEFSTGGVAVDLALAVHRHAGVGVFPDVDVAGAAGAADVVVVVVPAHDEAARGQGGDVGDVLAAVGLLVDLEFAAQFVAAGVEALGHHRPAAGVVAVRGPDDDESAVGERSDGGDVISVGGLALVAAGRRVDQEAAAEGVGHRVVDAAIDAVAAAVVAAAVGPHDHHAAVAQGGGVGYVLGTALGGAARHHGADQGFRADLGAGVVEALQVDVAAVGPHAGKTAGVGGDVVVVLGAAGGGVNLELRALGHAGRVVALTVDAVAAAVVTHILPGNDVVARGQPGDLGPVLGASGQTVDPEFGTDGFAIVGVALRIDAIPGAILARGHPGHHIAAVGELRRRRPLLIVGRVGIDLLLTVGRRGTVQILGDVDGERIGIAAAAVAVGDPQAQGAAGVGAGVGVGIAQALDEGFHRFHRRGVAGEVDDQVGAVDAAADRADGSAAIAHRAAGNTDLPGAGALVDHAQLVFDRSVLGVVEIEPAAVEVAGIRVAQTDRRIDHLQAAIDRVFSEGDGADEVGQRRAGRAGEFRGVAEELLVDAVGVGGFGFVVEAAPDHREVALPQIHHRRFEFSTGGVAVDLALAVHRHAGVGVFPDVDVAGAAGAADVVVVVVPAHDEAARGQGGDVGDVLTARGSFVDLEFAAQFVAAGVEALGHHRPAAGVVAVRGPDDDESAVGKGRHGGGVVTIATVALAAAGRGIDQEAAAESVGHRVVDAAIDPVDAAVVAATVAPHDHHAAVAQGGGVGYVLGTALGGAARHHGADQGFGPDLDAGVVEALQVDVAAVGPHAGKAAGVGGDVVVVLGAAGGGVNLELHALGHAGRVVALTVDAVAAAVVTHILPGNDVVARGQPGDLGPVLGASGQTVDPEFGAQGLAIVGVALRIDAVPGTVLTRGHPGHHVAAVRQLRRRRPLLLIGRIGIDLLLTVGRRRAVDFARHVDGDHPRLAGTTVAVIDAQRNGPAGLRTARTVGVGEVLDQLLHGVDRGAGVQSDDQGSAVAAPADRTDDLGAASVVEGHVAA